MKKIMLILVLLSAAVFTANAKDLTIGMRSTKFPFSYKENGVFKGFEYDLLNAVCEEIERKCNIKELKWTELFKELKNDNIDLIFSSVVKTEKRKETMLFSEVYFYKKARLIKNKNLIIKLNMKNVEGKKIGLLKNSSHVAFVESQFQNAFNVFTYNNYDEIYKAFVNGEVDFIFLDELFAEFGFLKTPEGQQFEFVGPSFNSRETFGEGAAMVIAINNKDDANKIKLKNLMNQGLERVWKNGTYLKLSKKYFDKDISNGIFDK